MVNLVYGSIFDSKCDLLIVPCDSFGGVTSFVFENLSSMDLPSSSKNIPYGTVNFVENYGNYDQAFIIGYAASVNGETSTSESTSITKIAKAIKNYSKSNNILNVNIPLLGAGAGGLSVKEAFDALYKGLQNENHINFNIFALTRDIYNNLKADLTPIKIEQKIKHPRVFISYTGQDKQNAKWVKSIATKLRKNGVDARLDLFHLKRGYDLPQWMTNEVLQADKILLICDKFYIEKADHRKGGVGWETMIIQGEMLSQGDNKNKFIAIVREEEIDKGLPIYMKSRYSFHWQDQQSPVDQEFKELLFSIFDCDTEPELGEIPNYIIENITI